MKQTQNQFFGKKVDLPDKLPEGSIYVCSDSPEVYFAGQSKEPTLIDANISSQLDNISDYTQGYYAMLTRFYEDGTTTDTVVSAADVGSWIDVEFTPYQTFDNRPLIMKQEYPQGFNSSTKEFYLAGLDQNSYANFRASMSFEPEDDEGQLEVRLFFERNSVGSALDSFPIETTLPEMGQGAGKDYPSEPLLSFFVGDTIEYLSPTDLGKCKFQIKSTVEGILKMRALTWYIQK